jgi:MFS family permease
VVGAAIDPKLVVVVGMIATGAIICGIGMTIDIWTLLIAMFLVGLAITPVGSGYGTLLQTNAPAPMIGRVAATMNTLIQTFRIVAMAGAGILGDVFGVRPVFLASGGVCILAGMLASLLFRREVGTETDSPPVN